MVRIIRFQPQNYLPGITSSNLVFPATLVLILIALSLRGTLSAKMPLGQKASL